MVVRIGVGATAAAAVIFSILLVSDALVFAASQNRERLYLVSDAEDSLSDGAAVLMGAAGMNILLEAQGALAAGPLDCQTARGRTAAIVAGLSDFQDSGGITVASTARLVPDAFLSDNLSMVAPFNGSVLGGVDISISMVATGESLSGAVGISRSEVHLVHIPVDIDRLSNDCVGALGAVARDLSSEVPANCTGGAADPLALEAIRSAAARVSADGFAFGFAYSVVPGAECSVKLQLDISQTGIVGPGGPFTVRLVGEGVAFFGQAASALPGGISWRTGP